MIKNYLKIAWRNLWKHKVYSLLNILGLSTGITACIIIMLFVFYEKSSDGIHSKNILTSKHVTAITGSRQKLGNNLDWGFSEMSVRINGRNTKEAISEIESTWKKMHLMTTLNTSFWMHISQSCIGPITPSVRSLGFWPDSPYSFPVLGCLAWLPSR